MRKKYKYPRTCHFPFSPGATSDDKILTSTDHFIGKEIVITEKMDGENTSIYKDCCHARSLDSKHHDYHSWLLNWMNSFNWNIEDDIRICGEYLIAKHSIEYDSLPSYFLGFSVWKEDTCFDWDNTIKYFEKYNITPVPVLYEGIYDENIIKNIAKESVNNGKEGIVVRIKDSFKYEDFSISIAKYVRKNHVQTGNHWKAQQIVQNKLKEQNKN